MALLSGLVVGIGAESAELSTALSKSERRIRQFRRRSERDFRQLSRTVARASVAATAAIGAVAVASVKAADDIAKSARNAGLGVESFQTLAFAFELGGSSAEALTKANQALARSIYDLGRGLSTQADAFDALGLSFEDLERLSPAQQLRTVLDALRDIPNVTERAALAQVVLGRAGKQLGTVLSQTSAEMQRSEDRLRSFGGVLSGPASANAELLVDRFTELRLAVSRNFSTGFLEAIGPVTDLSNALRTIGESANFAGRAIGNMVIFIADNRETILTVFGALALARIARGWHGVARAIGVATAAMRFLLRASGFLLLIEGVLLAADAWRAFTQAIGDVSAFNLLRVAFADAIANLVNTVLGLPQTFFNVLRTIADLFNTTFFQVARALYEEFVDLIDRIRGVASNERLEVLQDRRADVARRREAELDRLQEQQSLFDTLAAQGRQPSRAERMVLEALEESVRKLTVETNALDESIARMRDTTEQSSRGFERLSETLPGALLDILMNANVIAQGPIDTVALARILHGLSEEDERLAREALERGFTAVGDTIAERFQSLIDQARSLAGLPSGRGPFPDSPPPSVLAGSGGVFTPTEFAAAAFEGAARAGRRGAGPRPRLRQDARDEVAEGFVENLRQGFYDAIREGRLKDVGRVLTDTIESTIIDSFAQTLSGNLAAIVSNLLESFLLSTFGNATGGVGGFLRGVFGFQHGGVVPGAAGSAQLILAHAGEVVLNPGQQRNLLAQLGGGTTVNVVNTVSDRADVTVDERDDSDGQRVIDVTVTGSLNRQGVTGDLDEVFGSFGGQRRLIGR